MNNTLVIYQIVEIEDSELFEFLDDPRHGGTSRWI